MRESGEDNGALSSSPSRKAIASLVLSIVPPVILAVSFAVSPPLGVLLSPFALVGSLVAVTLATWARRDVAHVYALGERVFQPVEPELLRDRSTAGWALGLGLPLIPLELLFTLVLFFF